MIKYILLDVEGTTTSIEFVHLELFPFSKEKMFWFVNVHPELCSQEKQQVEAELAKKLTDKDFSDQLLAWIEADKKHPALKSVQGKIWQLGYESGEIKGHVYPDVRQAFQYWREQGLRIGIYSSGSVLAQKLLFRYSLHGDLTTQIDDHFDTKVGAKREVGSYLSIARELGVDPETIVFLSDIAEECLAAKSAGMKSLQLIRDDKAKAHPDLKQIKDFSKVLESVV